MTPSSIKGKDRALAVDRPSSTTQQQTETQVPDTSGNKRPQGKGKKRKTFSEDLGIDHLKALSASIAGEKEQGANDRLQKAKERKQHAEKKKSNAATAGSGLSGKGNRIIKVSKEERLIAPLMRRPSFNSRDLLLCRRSIS